MNPVRSNEGLGLVVKTVTRWLKAFIMLFGLVLVLYGHHIPGRGFAGGVVIACAFILVTLAYGQRFGLKVLNARTALFLGSIGGLIFLGTALGGMLWGPGFCADFLKNAQGQHPRLLPSGVIGVYDIGVGLLVSMLLYLLFTMLSALHIAAKSGHRRMIRRGRN